MKLITQDNLKKILFIPVYFFSLLVICLALIAAYWGFVLPTDSINYGPELVMISINIIVPLFMLFKAERIHSWWVSKSLLERIPNVTIIIPLYLFWRIYNFGIVSRAQQHLETTLIGWVLFSLFIFLDLAYWYAITTHQKPEKSEPHIWFIIKWMVAEGMIITWLYFVVISFIPGNI